VKNGHFESPEVHLQSLPCLPKDLDAYGGKAEKTAPQRIREESAEKGTKR
jgi:hypothetical protein